MTDEADISSPIPNADSLPNKEASGVPTADGNQGKSLLHVSTSYESSTPSDNPQFHLNQEVFATTEEVWVDAVDGVTGANVKIRYTNAKTFASGAFGMVFVALLNNDKLVAIKKILRDKRYKNRELQVLRKLRHPNIVSLLYFFFSLAKKENEEESATVSNPCDCCHNGLSTAEFMTSSAFSPRKPFLCCCSAKPKIVESYLNLVQEYVPETLSRIIKHYASLRELIPISLVKVYAFQMLRGLAYVHSRNMCHRDIKPQNLLVNPETGILKICDFGSTKVLVPGEPNVAYICSRYYRAPELIFGTNNYTVSIDVWSSGCVLGEMLLGRPLFPGDSGVDQLVEIIKVLGTPTVDEVMAMNPHYSKFAFPIIKGCPWEKLIHHRSNDEAFELLRNLLVYSPSVRKSAADSLSSQFFSDVLFTSPIDERSPEYCLPNGRPLPMLIDNFSDEEFAYLGVEFARKVREFNAGVHPSPNEFSMDINKASAEGKNTNPTLSASSTLDSYFDKLCASNLSPTASSADELPS